MIAKKIVKSHKIENNKKKIVKSPVCCDLRGLGDAGLLLYCDGAEAEAGFAANIVASKSDAIGAVLVVVVVAVAVVVGVAAVGDPVDVVTVVKFFEVA